MKRIFAKLSFLSAEEGGRVQPIPVMNFSCPAFFDMPPLSECGHDCRILIPELGRELFPGGVFENVPMVFVWEDDVVPHLKMGDKFKLWEGRIIAEGEVQKIPD